MANAACRVSAKRWSFHHSAGRNAPQRPRSLATYSVHTCKYENAVLWLENHDSHLSAARLSGDDTRVYELSAGAERPHFPALAHGPQRSTLLKQQIVIFTPHRQAKRFAISLGIGG